MKKISAYLVIAASLFLSSSFSLASPVSRDPHKAFLDATSLPSISRLDNTPADSKIHLSLNTYLPAAGQLSFVFNRLQKKDWQSFFITSSNTLQEDTTHVSLLQGYVEKTTRGKPSEPRIQRKSRLPASAVVYVNGDSLNVVAVSFAERGRWGSRFYHIQSTSDKSKGLVVANAQSAPGIALAYKNLAADMLLPPMSINVEAAPNPQTRAATYLQADLITDCDYECYLALGGSAANTKIAGFVNSVNTIYQSQLGLTFKITKQYSRTSASPYSSATTSETLLTTFTNVASGLGASDIKHLVTGKNLEDNVIGLGYSSCDGYIPGTVCLCPEYGAALSQYINDAYEPIVMAHEMGHNLGADHDPSSSGIMAAALGSPLPTMFSNYSVQEISSFLSSYGGYCLSNVSSSSSSSSSSSQTSSSSSSSAGQSSSSSNSSSNSTSSSSSSSASGGGSVDDGITNPGVFAGISTSFRSAAFSATITAPSGFSDCSVNLYGGASKAKASAKTLLLASGSISNTPLVLSANSLPALKPVHGQAVKAYLVATLSCSNGGTIRTNLKGLTISVKKLAKKQKYTTSASAWLKALKKKLQ